MDGIVSEKGALLVSAREIHIGLAMTLKMDCFFVGVDDGSHTLKEQAKWISILAVDCFQVVDNKSWLILTVPTCNIDYAIGICTWRLAGIVMDNLPASSSPGA